MRILLINPPYLTLTSILGVGHQVPLGLLMVGGSLIDACHEVELLDAERRHLSIRRIIREVRKFQPDIVMTGHAGSTPAHPVCMKMLRAIRDACPEIITVYGGVYPTYHAADILQADSSVDVIVRGEGEAKAYKIYANAYKQDPKFFEFVRTMEAYKKTFAKDTTMVLTPDSEFLKFLKKR